MAPSRLSKTKESLKNAAGVVDLQGTTEVAETITRKYSERDYSPSEHVVYVDGDPYTVEVVETEPNDMNFVLRLRDLLSDYDGPVLGIRVGVDNPVPMYPQATDRLSRLVGAAVTKEAT